MVEASQESKVIQDPKAIPDHKDPKAISVCREIPALMGLPDPRAIRVIPARWDQLAPPVPLVRQDPKVRRVKKVKKVTRVIRDHKVHRDRAACRVKKVPKATSVRKALKVLRDRRDHPDLPGLQDLLATTH